MLIEDDWGYMLIGDQYIPTKSEKVWQNRSQILPSTLEEEDKRTSTRIGYQAMLSKP